jgi:hypothetical protein
MQMTANNQQLGSVLANSVSTAINPIFNEVCALYQPNVQTLSSKDDVSGPLTLVASNVICSLSSDADADATAAAYLLGIDPMLTVMAYFPSAVFGLVHTRTVLLDSDNTAWLIMNMPVLKNRHTATEHVQCLLRLLELRPKGLPPIT